MQEVCKIILEYNKIKHKICGDDDDNNNNSINNNNKIKIQ